MALVLKSTRISKIKGVGMQRTAIKNLENWKNKRGRKPLILNGARQVGKTWLATEFGKQNFDEVAHVVFLDNERMSSVFEGSLEPDRLLRAIATETNTHPKSRNCLVVLDEIQECPRAIESLKLFCEQSPDVPIIAAGSLLGIAMHRGASFPVGKVDMLNLYPMTFYEFLLASSNENLANLLDNCDFDLIASFSEKFRDEYLKYMVVGGMPEAVQAHISGSNFSDVRDIQQVLLSGYENDFSKHTTPAQTEKIRHVWKSVPSQFVKENKKFLYSAVKKGARARGYEEAIDWLQDAGLAHKVSRIKAPRHPLSAYADLSAFKLFAHDVGLFGAMAGLAPEVIVQDNPLLTEFKGAVAEQFACLELIAEHGITPYYWSAENSSGEVDFVFEMGAKICPCEVKSKVNLKSKSLKIFREKNNLETAIRFSLANFEKQEHLINLPLYAIHCLKKCTQSTMATRK